MNSLLLNWNSRTITWAMLLPSLRACYFPHVSAITSVIEKKPVTDLNGAKCQLHPRELNPLLPNIVVHDIVCGHNFSVLRTNNGVL